MSYANPVGPGAIADRVDQGVDYRGTPELFALGDGLVVSTFNAGWPGGAFVCVQLTGSGAFQNRYVYYAENLTPAVQVGQRVAAGQLVGRANGSYPFIELGWAAPPGGGGTMASQAGEISAGQAHGDPGYYPTAFGVDFSNVIASLGGPPGIVTGPVQGSIPANWQVTGPIATTGQLASSGVTGTVLVPLLAGLGVSGALIGAVLGLGLLAGLAAAAGIGLLAAAAFRPAARPGGP